MPIQERHKTDYPGIYFILGEEAGSGKPERIYYMMYRKDKKQIHEKAGRAGKDAMTAAKAAKIRIERMKAGGCSNKQKRAALEAAKNAEAGRWTFNRLWAAYQENKPIKGIKTDKNRFENHIKPLFGDKEPAALVPLDVDRLRLKMLKTHSPATVYNTLELLRRISNFGEKKKLCPGLQFIVEMPTVENETTECLEPGQLKKLLKVLDSHGAEPAALIMKLALFSGLRRGEILKLKWQNVDIEKGFVFLDDPKGGEGQTLPLSPAALEVLKKCPRHKTSPYVFPGKHGGQRTNTNAVNAFKKEAKLPADFRPLHGLRHNFASLLVESGIDLYRVQRLLTHKSAAMTQRYAHLKDKALRDAASTAAAAILGGPKAKKKTGTENK
jgi:integrase